mmetsp:Transcript_55562/g.163206  ORF Transcript_55562/g.163206 Transcript_55562/m.163206 type:complete len:207 (+) Transcript_55562:614-1234(+)
MSSLTLSPTASSSVPWRSSECIAWGTELKYSLPTWVPSVSCRNTMAKTYITIMRRHSTKKTERMAAPMPFTRMSSSGMALKRRAILAIRESRRSLAIRSMEALPRPPPPAPPVSRRTPVMTQVSPNIMTTRQVSKTNQPSFMPFRLILNAMKRMNHSSEKYRQKKCSAIWNTGLALSNTSAVLRSVSIAIQRALKPITRRVRFSKT